MSLLTQTPAWTTSDGKIHNNYLLGIKHELTMAFEKTGENVVGARKIVAALDADSIDELIKLMSALKSELANPTYFEMITAERPPIDIEPLRESVSLGIVGQTQDQGEQGDTEQSGEDLLQLTHQEMIGLPNEDQPVRTDPPLMFTDPVVSQDGHRVEV